MLLSALFMIVGCGGGGGQSVLQQESPESAVMRISNNWRASTDSPAVVVDANNRFIRQATDQDSSSSSSSSSSGKVIYLKDLAGGEPYKLEVVGVERVEDKATVDCRFYYESGALYIKFYLVFDEEKWWLEDVSITEEKLGKDEAYYYICHIGPDDKELFDQEQLKGTIGDSVSAKGHEKDDNDNYVYDPDASSNTIEGKIDSAGLKLIIYYKRREAKYTVVYNFLDENGQLDNEKTKEFSGVGKVGDTVDLSEIEKSMSFDGYNKNTVPESLVINRDENSNNFVFEYQKIKKTDPDPDPTPTPDPEEQKYSISGAVTDSNGKVIDDTEVTIKFYKLNDDGTYEACLDSSENEIVIKIQTGNYDTSTNDYFFEEGEYLLVVTAEGYESQTIKVTLPKDSTANNYRANISL